MSVSRFCCGRHVPSAVTVAGPQSVSHFARPTPRLIQNEQLEENPLQFNVAAVHLKYGTFMNDYMTVLAWARAMCGEATCCMSSNQMLNSADCARLGGRSQPLV